MQRPAIGEQLRPIAAAIGMLVAVSGVAWAASPAVVHPPVYRWLEIGNAKVLWQMPRDGSRLTVTYAVLDTERTTPAAINCGRMSPPDGIAADPRIGPDGIAKATRIALDRWEGVAPFTFVATNDVGSAGIVIGAQADPVGYAFTDLRLGTHEPGAAHRFIVAASICLNPERRWKLGFDGNLARYDLVHTIAHEIGHALGLDHPGPRGHLMSFRYDETVRGLTDGDIAGIRALYGITTPVAPERFVVGPIRD